MLVNDVTDATHELNLRIVDASATRMATLASAKAGLLGGFGQGIEAHLLAVWSTRRARRPAINSGRAHGENEAAVARSITREDRIPHLRIVHRRRHCR